MHYYMPKKKKDALDGQRSNENDESVANNFSDLKTLYSTVEKHEIKVINIHTVPVKVKSAAQGKDVLTYAMLDIPAMGPLSKKHWLKRCRYQEGKQ